MSTVTGAIRTAWYALRSCDSREWLCCDACEWKREWDTEGPPTCPDCNGEITAQLPRREMLALAWQDLVWALFPYHTYDALTDDATVTWWWRGRVLSQRPRP